MFPPGPLDGYYPRFQGDWHRGLSLWTQDYPRADRHFSLALRRLSRVQVRSVEQPVDLEDGDEVFNWPWLYAVQVGEWGLTENQAESCANICCAADSSWPTIFTASTSGHEFEKRINFVFPDRPIVDIPDNDAIFHTVYDLDDRPQVPGQAHLREGSKNGGDWRALARNL